MLRTVPHINQAAQSAESGWFKEKITACAAISSQLLSKTGILSRFHHGANALGAKHFTNHLAVLKDADGLEIGFEGTLSGLIRPWTIATEGCFLTTMCTFSHNSTSLVDRSYHREYFA